MAQQPDLEGTAKRRSPSTGRRGGRPEPATRPASWSRRRDEIIATACRLMSEGGYRAISMERLADELGVTKPTVYYYVDSKRALWSALADITTENSARLRDVCAAIDDPLERLRTLVHESVAISTSEQRWAAAASDRDHFPDDMDSDIAERLVESARSWFRTVISVVRDAVAAGVMPPVDPNLGALNLIAMGAWCSKWYGRDYSVTPEAIEQSIIALLVHRSGEASVAGAAQSP